VIASVVFGFVPPPFDSQLCSHSIFSNDESGLFPTDPGQTGLRITCAVPRVPNLAQRRSQRIEVEEESASWIRHESYAPPRGFSRPLTQKPAGK